MSVVQMAATLTNDALAKVQQILQDPLLFCIRAQVRLKDRRLTHLGEVMSDEQVAILEALQAHRRLAVVKARQMGITTVVRAWMVWKAFTVPGFHGALLSNKERGAKEIGHIDRRILAGLQEALGDITGKIVKSQSQQEVVLANGSRLLYFSGKSSNDRGYTLDALHVTEFAHVDEGSDVLASMMQSIAPEGTAIIESTPSHFGDPLHRIAHGGADAWKLLFFPWYGFEAYRLPVPAKQPVWDAAEQHLMTLGVEPEQLMWRRWKVSELSGDLVLFAREFPSSMEEAYALADGAWLDGDTLGRARVGIYRTRWEGSQGAGVRVDTLCEKNDAHHYIIGYDPSGGTGNDDAVAKVMDRNTMDIVETISCNRQDPETFSQRVAVLAGKWGKDGRPCMVCVELNNHGHRAKLVLELAGVPVYGWETTGHSKHDMLNGMRHKLYERLLGTIDTTTKQQLGTMMRGQGQKAPAGATGTHDDHVMALALVVQLHGTLPPPPRPISQVEEMMSRIGRPKTPTLPAKPLR